MATKTMGSAGRFGVRYGKSVRIKIAKIEARQRKKQACIFCNGRVKRLSKGIWLCKKCGKKFAGHAYYLANEYTGMKMPDAESKKEKAKSLKKESASEGKEKVKKSAKSKSKKQE